MFIPQPLCRREYTTPLKMYLSFEGYYLYHDHLHGHTCVITHNNDMCKIKKSFDSVFAPHIYIFVMTRVATSNT